MSLQASQRTSDWTVCKYEPTQVGSQDEFWIKSNLFSGEPLLGRTWIHEHWMIHLTFAGPWVEFLSHGLRGSEKFQDLESWTELNWVGELGTLGSHCFHQVDQASQNRCIMLCQHSGHSHGEIGHRHGSLGRRMPCKNTPMAVEMGKWWSTVKFGGPLFSNKPISIKLLEKRKKKHGVLENWNSSHSKNKRSNQLSALQPVRAYPVKLVGCPILHKDPFGDFQSEPFIVSLWRQHFEPDPSSRSEFITVGQGHVFSHRHSFRCWPYGVCYKLHRRLRSMGLPEKSILKDFVWLVLQYHDYARAC